MNHRPARLLFSTLILLFWLSSNVIAEPEITDERADELRQHIESQRTETLKRLKSQINGLSRLDVPNYQKPHLRKQWTQDIENCKSPDFIPYLNLKAPKGIGWVVLAGESSESIYGRVLQVIDDDEFLMNIQKKEARVREGTFSGRDLGEAIQDAASNPQEVDLGLLWVKGCLTENIEEGKCIKLKGVFVADGNKSYSTAAGKRKTVELIHLITDLSKIKNAEKQVAETTEHKKPTSDKKSKASTEKPGKKGAKGVTQSSGTPAKLADDKVIFSDDFESESRKSQKQIENYRQFKNWDVFGSGVELVGPDGGYPARIDSQMVDLDGTSGSQLVSKRNFRLLPGEYILTFDIHGPVGGKHEDTVVVKFGEVFSESIILKLDDPVVTIKRTIAVNSATEGKLSFKDLGADSNGAFLDNVEIKFTPIK